MAGKELNDLLESIYAASLDASQWWQAVPQLAGFLDTPSASIEVRRGRDVQGLAMTANLNGKALQSYVEYYANINPWVAAWQRQGGENGVFSGAELIAPTHLFETEFYQDFARPHGIFHFVGAAVASASKATILFGLHRPKGAAAFHSSDIARIHQILPHVARAVDIQTALAAADLQRRGALDALDRLALGVALVDGEGRLAYANPTAEALMRQGNGLIVRNGKVRASMAPAIDQLAQAVRQSAEIALGAGGTVSDVVRLPRRGKPPLSALVAPLLADRTLLALTGTTVIIFLFDPDASTPPTVNILMSLYHLTPAEARLLHALLAGDRISDYAEAAGISINTATTQLKQLFAKTDTGRQSDLIRHVLRDLTNRLAGRA